MEDMLLYRTMNMNHPRLATARQQQQQQTSPSNNLDDVLHDPDASWSQIREAMRASRGCTNAAVMGAIATGRGASVSAAPVDDDPAEERLSHSDVKAAAEASEAAIEVEEVDLKVPLNDCSAPETTRDLRVPLNDADSNSNADVTNSRNRRPARRSGRRNSLRGSGARGSFRRSSSFRRSRRGTNGPTPTALLGSSFRSIKSNGEGSVNMMDFGVDHGNNCMSTLDESVSLDGGMEIMLGSNSRHSWVSHGDDSGASCASGSLFLGWNHDDEESSCYSDMVDSCGFLDWERKNSVPSEPASPMPCKIASTFENNDTCLDSGPVGGSRRGSGLTKSLQGSFMGSITSSIQGSFNASAASGRGLKVETWNIEDYENPEDNVVKKRSGNFFGRLGRRLSNELDHHAAAAPAGGNAVSGLGRNEGIKMDDIKEALIKVAHSSEKNETAGSAPASRRTSLDEERMFPTPASNKRNDKKKGPKRRQTVMGMPSALPAFLNKSNDEEDEELKRMPSAGSDGNRREPKPGRMTLTGMSLFLSSESEPQIGNLSRRQSRASRRESELSDSLPTNSNDGLWNKHMSELEDSRDAIWISGKDGGVDIDKERRKLYSEEASKDRKDPKKKEGFMRRTTLFGAERPGMGPTTRTASKEDVWSNVEWG